jgi:lysozyme family protein
MRQDILNHNKVIHNIKNGTAPVSDSSTTATALSTSDTGSIASSGTTLTRDGTRPVTVTGAAATAISGVGHTTIHTEVTHTTDATVQTAEASG